MENFRYKCHILSDVFPILYKTIKNEIETGCFVSDYAMYYWLRSVGASVFV